MFKKRLKKIYSHRGILFDITIKQLKAKYAGSKMGIWWAVITPVILAISINFVFSGIFKVDIPLYALFVLAGILPWMFFSQALIEAANSFMGNASLVKQAIFPRELIPISCCFSQLLNFLIGLIFLSPVFIFFNPGIMAPLLFIAPVVILHFFFILGLSFLFSTINVFFRDLIHFLNIALLIWFWITPVFYSSDMLPPEFRWLLIFNPMTYFTELYRSILFYGRVPEMKFLFISLLLAFFFFSAGYFYFLKTEKELLKRI